MTKNAIEQELRDRRVEDRANATSSAQQGLCPCELLHSKGSDKIYTKKVLSKIDVQEVMTSGAELRAAMYYLHVKNQK